MSTIAFLHAHPDDEAIFTGGTIPLLTALGHRVVLILATSGELGEATGTGELLGERRRIEAARSAEILGVDSTVFMGFRDSGMSPEGATRDSGSFCSVLTDHAATQLASTLRADDVESLVIYDPNGIYGHPDHVKCHQVGIMAARMAGIASLYEMTVDREYLHFVETHLVTEAALAGDLGLAGSNVGYSSVEIDLSIDVRGALDTKRSAMAAHASQLPDEAPVFALDDSRFADVYGWEWYVRRGAPGALDELRRPRV